MEHIKQFVIMLGMKSCALRWGVLACLLLVASSSLLVEALEDVKSFSGCFAARQHVEAVYAQVHFTLFSMDAQHRTDEQLAALDAMVYEHQELHQQWLDTCGAGGGGGGGGHYFSMHNSEATAMQRSSSLWALFSVLGGTTGSYVCSASGNFTLTVAHCLWCSWNGGINADSVHISSLVPGARSLQLCYQPSSSNMYMRLHDMHGCCFDRTMWSMQWHMLL